MNPFAYSEYKNNLSLDKFGIHNPIKGKGEDKDCPIRAEKNNMAELKEDVIKGDLPDYKGDGVAVWVKKDRNGKQYLSICVLSKINLAAFKYEPKEKK